MKKSKTDTILFVSAIISMAAVSFSFLLLAIETEKTVSDIPVTSFITGVIFWLFTAISAVLLAVLSVRRRKFYAKVNVKQSEKIKYPGLIAFFKNRIARAADIFMIICAVAFAVVFVVTHGAGLLCYITVSLLLLSVCLHSVFNGKIFYYICIKEKVLRVQEKKAKKNERNGTND